MPTIASGTSPYCTPAQALERLDVRTCGQLLSDTGTPLTQSQVLASSTFNDLLMQSSGMVEAYAMRGGAYTINPLFTPPRNDLAAIAAGVLVNGVATPSNQSNLLAGIVAGILLMFLWERRPNPKPGEKPPGAAERAMGFLEELGNGVAVFGTVENQAAGVMSDTVEVARDVEVRGGLLINSERFWGRRSNRIPPFGG